VTQKEGCSATHLLVIRPQEKGSLGSGDIEIKECGIRTLGRKVDNQSKIKLGGEINGASLLLILFIPAGQTKTAMSLGQSQKV